jgi:hypothetical protein
MNVPTGMGVAGYGPMRPGACVAFLLALLVPALAHAGDRGSQVAGGGAKAVTLDRYSMSIDGKRVFLNSGEVHPFRMPSPRAWPEMLRKLRAGGLNAVSIYIPWSLHESAPGVFRFNGRWDLERFLREARDAGLYVVARPGPYVQAEIDGGGFPGWLLGSPGVLRTVDPNYTRAWKRWFGAVMPRIARWQHGGANGGTVVSVQIENEFPGDSEEARTYIRDLVATAKADGITVPVSHNDVQFLGVQLSRGLFVNDVDLFGFDNYPYGFQCCSKPWDTSTFSQVDQFEDYYRGKGVTDKPLYTAEIQGGIAPIAGDDGATQAERYKHFTGYGTVQDISLLGQGLTAINRYMTFGGTTWGNLLFPNDGSPYDYAAPVREWGGLGPRYDELRRIGLQIEALRGFVEATERVPNSAVETSSADHLYRVRRTVGGEALHVFLRNADGRADENVAVSLGGRSVRVPLPARSARWVIARLRTRGWSIDLSAAEVADVDSRRLVLFGDRGREYRAFVNGRTLDLKPRRRPYAISVPGGRRVFVLDRGAAARLWKRGSALWVGPYLVTSSVVETTRRTAVQSLAARGRSVRTARVAGPPRVKLPVLRGWRFSGSSTPEAAADFDDSSWLSLEKAATTNQVQPLTSPVLAADEYGVPGSGFLWYRGRFTGRANGICLEGRHRFHVWVNGRSLRTVTSGHEIPGPSGFGGLGASPPVSAPVTVPFPADAVGSGSNVVSVLVESWGHTMDAAAANQAKQPRGLISASLDRVGTPPCGFAIGGETTTPLGGGTPATAPSLPAPSGGIDWRLRGAAPSDYPQTSGLNGEVAGFHKPGFDDSGWAPAALPGTLALGNGEIGWLRSSFDLKLPRGVEARLGMEIPRSSQPANVYLNGVLIARAGRGPYTRFVLPPGLVKMRGRNVIAIARWAVDGEPRMELPKLVAYEVVRRTSPRAVERALR